jgi:hypothetical protein
VGTRRRRSRRQHLPVARAFALYPLLLLLLLRAPAKFRVAAAICAASLVFFGISFSVFVFVLLTDCPLDRFFEFYLACFSLAQDVEEGHGRCAASLHAGRRRPEDLDEDQGNFPIR